MKNSLLTRVAGIAIFAFGFLGSQVHAQSQPESVLLPIPGYTSLYEKSYAKLSPQSQWKLRRHALRHAPLHPDIWSPLKIDRTHNRTMVPIRPYFLRASENPKFNLKSLELDFQFKAAKKRYMTQTPHQKDPVLEIGLGGVFKSRPLDKDGLVSHGYAIRLSAFPPVKSGIYFRSGTNYKLLTEPDGQIEVGTPYNVKVIPRSRGFKLSLNDKVFLQSKDAQVTKGLVSLQNSWHPLKLSSLEIKGSLKGKPWKDSGLVNFRTAKGLNNAQ